MSFWSDSKLEPKRSFRWLGIITLFGKQRQDPLQMFASVFNIGNPGNIAPFLVKSFTKPSYTIPTNKIKGNFVPRIENVVGTPEWNDIEIVAYDVVDPVHNASKILYEYLRNNGYQPGVEIGQGNGIEANKALAAFSEGKAASITLQLINSNGNSIEEWRILKPVLKEFEFGGILDYESDEVTTIKMSFTISGAEYKYIGGGGVSFN